jgi:hypothetical protein
LRTTLFTPGSTIQPEKIMEIAAEDEATPEENAVPYNLIG